MRKLSPGSWQWPLCEFLEHTADSKSFSTTKYNSTDEVHRCHAAQGFVSRSGNMAGELSLRAMQALSACMGPRNITTCLAAAHARTCRGGR